MGKIQSDSNLTLLLVTFSVRSRPAALEKNNKQQSDLNRVSLLHHEAVAWNPMMTSSNGNIFHVTGPLWGKPRSPVDSPHKGQWRGALMFSLICAWTNGWANNRDAGNVRIRCVHYDVPVMHTPFCYAHRLGMEIYTVLESVSRRKLRDPPPRGTAWRIT